MLKGSSLHTVEWERDCPDTLWSDGFRLQLRGPSVVILSLLENAEHVHDATEGAGVTTMDVRLENESALFDLIRGLLQS
jgi:hypothetical protein